MAGELEALLAERIGLDPSTVGNGLLDRALHARMAARGLARPEEYLDLLRRSPAEQEELVEEVVIPESWFFRDGRPFTLFGEFARGRAAGGAVVRALSLPCAAGEEPYSLAITLLEAGLPAARWVLHGVDISARVLVRAARGVYRENAFRGSDPALRVRYFEAGPQGFEIAPAVRAAVRFVHGNLLDPALLKGEAPYDAIFCRNVLIYLDPASRRRAVETLDRLLAPAGMLFLGHADNPGDGGHRFESTGDKGAFAYRRATPKSRSGVMPSPAGANSRSGVMPSPAGANSRSGVMPSPVTPPAAAAPARAAAAAAAPAEDLETMLERALALAGGGQNAQAVALCEQALRRHGPAAPAFFLLGMIRHASGDLPGAEESLKKAVYLDPGHQDALLALALAADRRGDAASAAGYRRRADRARHNHQRRRREGGEA